jgi:hypothetical protein
LESKKLVVPILLDEGAKQNWLWPLLAPRQSIELNIHSERLDDQLELLIDSPNAPRKTSAYLTQQRSVPTAATAAGFWKYVLVAIASAALGALATWLLR